VLRPRFPAMIVTPPDDGLVFHPWSIDMKWAKSGKDDVIANPPALKGLRKHRGGTAISLGHYPRPAIDARTQRTTFTEITLVSRRHLESRDVSLTTLTPTIYTPAQVGSQGSRWRSARRQDGMPRPPGEDLTAVSYSSIDGQPSRWAGPFGPCRAPLHYFGRHKALRVGPINFISLH
jgi:hypothetical protein